jgi:hypothetical protein
MPSIRPPRNAGGVVAAVLSGALLLIAVSTAAGELKYQYWATSLSGEVDRALLRGLYQAVNRGEIGWLDVDPQNPMPRLRRTINLVLYHVGGTATSAAIASAFPFPS